MYPKTPLQTAQFALYGQNDAQKVSRQGLGSQVLNLSRVSLRVNLARERLGADSMRPEKSLARAQAAGRIMREACFELFLIDRLDLIEALADKKPR